MNCLDIILIYTDGSVKDNTLKIYSGMKTVNAKANISLECFKLLNFYAPNFIQRALDVEVTANIYSAPTRTSYIHVLFFGNNPLSITSKVIDDSSNQLGLAVSLSNNNLVITSTSSVTYLSYKFSLI